MQNHIAKHTPTRHVPNPPRIPTYDEVAKAFAQSHPSMHLVAFDGYLPGGGGTLASAIILAHAPGQLHPYIVWMLVWQEDGTAACSSGGYHERLADAVQDFTRQAAHDSWPVA